MEETLATVLQINNPFAKEQIAEGIKAWPKDTATCLKRATTFQALREHLGDNPQAYEESRTHFTNLEAAAKKLEPLLREPTDVEKESYSQVCFRGTPWASLNTIPFALIALSFYKSFIVPGFSIILPIISLILPFLLLRMSYNIPITMEEYASILWRMWNGQKMPMTPEEILQPQLAVPQPPQDPITRIKTLAQNGWTLFAVGQTIWQPIQQARHFMTLDADCLALGNCLIGVKGIGLELTKAWKAWVPGWLAGWLAECPDDPRQAFAFAIETPFWLRHTFRALGRLEVVLALAGREDVTSAEFVGGAKPVLVLKRFGDPSIPMDRRVLSSVGLGGGRGSKTKSHAILTGPNRGGKSSFLRGVLMNVVVAHCFGAAFAAKAQMTPFTWIADGMRLDDTPGKQSMFEREVAFGSAVLAKEGGRGLVLYDELFHSTNPPDAKRTSELFCNSLWKKDNCLSIVSTHVYSLARDAPAEAVDQMCVAAWRSEQGKLLFSYKIQKGVCEVSSVDLLLKQFGLVNRVSPKENES
jgi:hypothetical protein